MGDPDTFREAVQKITKWSFSSETPKVLTTLAVKRLADVGPRVLQSDFQVCNDFDITHRIGKINQPVLVVCGQDDKMTPVQEALFLAENIPNAEFKLIPGAGHMVMLEKPDLVGSILADFFSRL
jgi:pimeloyl-ACP methyl ester carboxylesterase